MMKEYNLAKLHTAVAVVAPISGVTWNPNSIQFRDEATAEQRAAAQAILDAWTDADFEPTPEEALEAFASSALIRKVALWAALQASYSELTPEEQAKAGPLRTKLRDLIVAGVKSKIGSLP